MMSMFLDYFAVRVRAPLYFFPVDVYVHWFILTYHNNYN